MSDERCENCKFFEEIWDKGLELASGNCRFKPPIPVYVAKKEDDVSLWPHVYNYEWCGEWKAKPETKSE